MSATHANWPEQQAATGIPDVDDVTARAERGCFASSEGHDEARVDEDSLDFIVPRPGCSGLLPSAG